MINGLGPRVLLREWATIVGDGGFVGRPRMNSIDASTLDAAPSLSKLTGAPDLQASGLDPITSRNREDGLKMDL